MFRKESKGLLGIIFLLLMSSGINHCSTGIETSPAAGILRITIQSNPADTFVVIVTDTFTVSCTDTLIRDCDTSIVANDTIYSNCDTIYTNRDFFFVTFSQAKAYSSDNYALLYTDPQAYSQEDSYFNALLMINHEYPEWTIYESRLPPQKYNRIQIGVNAERLRIGTLDIPVQLPPDTSLLMDFYRDFTIDENRVTEINLQISPFQSIERYKDIYHFTREIEVINVKYD